MSTVIEKLERAQLRRLPDFRPGDRVRIHFQVIEGTRRRTQVFEGVVIARSGHGVRETITVRKQSFGVGVERVFPLHSPKIEQIEVMARGDVRRAKLYYLRDRVGKKARVRERTDITRIENVAHELLEQPVEEQEVEETPVDSAVEEAPVEAVESAEADAAVEGDGGAEVTPEAEAEPAPEAEAETPAEASADAEQAEESA